MSLSTNEHYDLVEMVMSYLEAHDEIKDDESDYELIEEFVSALEDRLGER